MKRNLIRRFSSFFIFVVLVFTIYGSGFTFTDSSAQYQITIDSVAHQKYGLYYPVTYLFNIPGGSSNLVAQYRYTLQDNWSTLTSKTKTDFFNGVNAARFDYANSIVYISVSFSLGSDTIYVRVLNGQTEVPILFSSIPLYYDNRRAAVSILMDDWNKDRNSSFDNASSYLTAAQIHFTVGINNNGSNGPDWSLIQNWYNQGYLEPGAHTRTHPCSDADYQVHGFDWEVAGIRDDILANLTLQYPYVPAFIEPCGFESPLIRQAVAKANYLADRGISGRVTTFSPWGEDGTYQPQLVTHSDWDWTTTHSQAKLDEANGYFDLAYTTGGIYTLLDHPWLNLFFPGSDLEQHINYIGNRKDVWYAGFGDLYLYHYVQERGKVSILPVVSNSSELSVSKAGNGSGVVTSLPSGINCGATCAANFTNNTMVTLTATASSGSIFTGWNGAGCSGTGTCVVQMDAAKNVTANFVLASYTVFIPILSK